MGKSFPELVKEFMEVEAELIQELGSLKDEELALPVSGHRRASDIRGLLSHFIYHSWDHAVHIVKTRYETGDPRGEANLLLGDLLTAHGQILGQAAGLCPEGLEKAPQGEWSVRQILEHVLDSDRRQLERIRQARGKA